MDRAFSRLSRLRSAFSRDCEGRSEKESGLPRPALESRNLSYGRPFRLRAASTIRRANCCEADSMNGLIYLIGLIVVIMAILSFLGLH